MLIKIVIYVVFSIIFLVICAIIVTNVKKKSRPTRNRKSSRITIAQPNQSDKNTPNIQSAMVVYYPKSTALPDSRPVTPLASKYDGVTPRSVSKKPSKKIPTPILPPLNAVTRPASRLTPTFGMPAAQPSISNETPQPKNLSSSSGGTTVNLPNFPQQGKIGTTNTDSQQSPNIPIDVAQSNTPTNISDGVETYKMSIIPSQLCQSHIQQKDGTTPFSQPVDTLISQQDAVASFASSSPTNPSIVTSQKRNSLMQTTKESKLIVRNIEIPAVVEQGDQDQPIFISIFNHSEVAATITQTNLKFYQNNQDISPEYHIHNTNNNPILIPPGASEEIRLSIDIVENATLGKILITPVIIFTSDPSSSKTTTVNTKVFQWCVEPNSRIFHILTEHQDAECAGIPFQITLEVFFNNELEKNYQGLHRVFFGTTNIANEASIRIPPFLDLSFKEGKAISSQCFCFFNTTETYILSAQEKNAGGPTGISNNILLMPGVLGSFRFEISSPQKHNIAFTGRNNLIALDIYNNVKTDYHSDTVLTCSEGSIKGLAANTIPGNVFHQGVVNLTALNFRIYILEFPNDGKVVKLTAHYHNKVGHSKNVTIIPDAGASTSSTGRQSRKSRKIIWIANTDTGITKELDIAFQNEYEIVIQELTIAKLDTIINNPPDLLFLGMETSENPYNLMRELRKANNIDNLSIFIIGPATESEAKINEVLKSGGIYLAKPLSMPTLRAMVAYWIQNFSMDESDIPTHGTRLSGSKGAVYEIVAKIGEGGMGFIYEAIRLRDQKKVVIKYLPPRDFNHIKSLVRFIQEAHTVLSCHHENLVTGYDMILNNNSCYYVMEFIEGETVEQLIQQEGKINIERATRIILQVAYGLQYLHEEYNLVHRDVKPSNILITDNGIAKLVDFGIIKISDHHLTTVGIVLGTPYYLSPEQILGQEITIQSDIYSLGATFYHMVTGQYPFQGADVYGIINQRLTGIPHDPCQYNPQLPYSISQIILRMMNQKTNKRYATPRDVIMNLEKALSTLPKNTLRSTSPLVKDQGACE